MSTITLNLPDELAKHLSEAGRQSSRTPEEVAQDMLKRMFALERFNRLSREVRESMGPGAPRTEEEIFEQIVRIVFDTNVLFAAFSFEQGFCAKLMRACLARHQLIISEHILSELRRHLFGKGRLSAPRVDEVIQFLNETAETVVPIVVPSDACRDPDDLPVLGTALAGSADCIVTGDRDLLTLSQFQGIQILSPRTLHDRLNQ